MHEIALLASTSLVSSTPPPPLRSVRVLYACVSRVFRVFYAYACFVFCVCVLFFFACCYFVGFAFFCVFCSALSFFGGFVRVSLNVHVFVCRCEHVSLFCFVFVLFLTTHVPKFKDYFLLEYKGHGGSLLLVSFLGSCFVFPRLFFFRFDCFALDWFARSLCTVLRSRGCRRR